MKDLGLFVLRVTFGSLIAVHGFPKLFGDKVQQVPPEVERILGPGFTQLLQQGGIDRMAQMLESMQMPAPKAMAGLSGTAEFFGGLALILGWHTRLASLALMWNMATAIRKVHWTKGLLGEGGAETPLLYFCAFLSIFIAGPGKISIDRG